MLSYPGRWYYPKNALQQEQPRERVSLDLLHQLISATTVLFVYCGDSIRSSENRP